MDFHGRGSNPETQSEEEMELRRGPWTMEEDLILVNYIANHGEGRWNSLARCAGLKRTGKSCRLRWLNYLRPDVRRGNITAEEQLLILELHSRWGNRWSKIAQYLPGRTDNEIKNYWRTRVQKQAKQLKCDVNSKQFKDTMRYLWMPRLAERIRAAAATTASNCNVATSHQNLTAFQPFLPNPEFGVAQINKPSITPEHSSADSLATSCTTQVVSPVSDDITDHYFYGTNTDFQSAQISCPESLSTSSNYYNHGLDFPAAEQNMWIGGDMSENTWNLEDIWCLQQQLCGGA